MTKVALCNMHIESRSWASTRVHERTRSHVGGQCFRVPNGRQPTESSFTDGQFMMDGRSPSKDTRREIDTRRLNPRAAVSAEEMASFHGFSGGRFRWHRLDRGWIDLIDGMGQDAR
jgi:hypothetical protein